MVHFLFGYIARVVEKALRKSLILSLNPFIFSLPHRNVERSRSDRVTLPLECKVAIGNRTPEVGNRNILGHALFLFLHLPYSLGSHGNTRPLPARNLHQFVKKYLVPFIDLHVFL